MKRVSWEFKKKNLLHSDNVSKSEKSVLSLTSVLVLH